MHATRMPNPTCAHPGCRTHVYTHLDVEPHVCKPPGCRTPHVHAPWMPNPTCAHTWMPNPTCALPLDAEPTCTRTWMQNPRVHTSGFRTHVCTHQDAEPTCAHIRMQNPTCMHAPLDVEPQPHVCMQNPHIDKEAMSTEGAPGVLPVYVDEMGIVPAPDVHVLISQTDYR